jgi:hypothetical protein
MLPQGSSVRESESNEYDANIVKNAFEKDEIVHHRVMETLLFGVNALHSQSVKIQMKALRASGPIGLTRVF